MAMSSNPTKDQSVNDLGLSEFALHLRTLQTTFARLAYWINIPFAALWALLGSFGFVPALMLPATKQGLHYLWLPASCTVLVAAAEMWEMWWNPFARDATACRHVSEETQRQMLEGNRRRVKEVWGIASVSRGVPREAVGETKHMDLSLEYW